MATIYIDGKPYQVKDGQNLLEACLSLGFDLPYFCWHPAMGSVGACRQCAVIQYKGENDAAGKLVMACMTPASDGTYLSIESPQAHEFRASVIEWLMVNHPHDCPVCDEGGECHLQDMTVMTGHAYREFRYQKRTHRNQDLGPFINHEMNRCIACYRCVRFYRDYAGGRDFNVFAAHDHVYFGRHTDGTLENEFSGNLVEVCPTGVFTDKTLKKHYSRKWDLQTAPSICIHCGLGCNTIPGERYGQLRRVRNRYNGEVNGYFLCDRGRYGYEFVNSEQRIRQLLFRKKSDEAPQPAGKEETLQQIASLLNDRGRVIGIGSPRASLEANFALRELVGADHFYQGVPEKDYQLVSRAIQILQKSPARTPSMQDTQLSSAALVLGEDLTNTAPMLALSLRQMVHPRIRQVARQYQVPEWNDHAIREIMQDEKPLLYLATPYATRLDEAAFKTYQAAPDDLARLGFAIAHAINAEAPMVDDLPEEVKALAEEIAHTLQGAEQPMVISGTSSGSETLLQAAANVAWALQAGGHPAGLCFTVPEANSMGLGLLGGGSLNEAFQAVLNGDAQAMIILENDLYRRAETRLVDKVLETAGLVIAIDHLSNATTAKAGIVLPAATFAESDGTLVNNEGRAQRFYQVFVPEGEIQESWRWARDILLASGRLEASQWQNLDDIVNALAQAKPTFAPVPDAAPPASFRISGAKVPRQSPRYSGRTSIHAHVNVHEPQPPDDPDSPLAFSMEGYEGQPPAPLIPRFWAPGWNSIQALNKFQEEISGPLRGGDPGCRLIEPTPSGAFEYFKDIPAAFKTREGQWLLIPIYHIFGSEPLSMLTPGVAERAPQPYLALNTEDAFRIGASEGDEVELALDDTSWCLPVRLLPGLAKGMAGLPAGLPGSRPLDLPGWFKIIERKDK